LAWAAVGMIAIVILMHTNYRLLASPMVVFPALAVVLAVLAFNLLGDAWRDWLDPRTRSQMTAMESSR